MVFGLVLAGGIGSRMGDTGKPKQYLEIGNKPVLMHTLDKFWAKKDIEAIYVLCPPVWIDYTKELLGKYLPEAGDRVRVISGGETRNETIMNGIAAIESEYGLGEETLIVTHDAARPFINERILTENIEAAVRDGQVTTAIPAVDTILQCTEGKYVVAIPERTQMYQCQTPQTFHAKSLREAYQSLSEEEKEILTDASKIMLMKGKKVAIVQGEVHNIKITYPNDLVIAEAYLRDETV